MNRKFFISSIFLASCFADGQAASNVWTPPSTIATSTNSINPTNSPLAIDTHSNALVGWLNGPFPTTANDIFSAYLPGGTTTWNPPETIFTGTPPEFPSYPIMYTDIDDHQIALWGVLNIGDATSSLNDSRRGPGDIGWPAPIQLNFSELTAGGGAQAGNLGHLIAFVANTPNFAPPYTLQMSVLSNSGTAWSPLIVLDQDNSAQPVLAAAVAHGSAVLAWRTDTPTLSMHSRRYIFHTDQLTVASDIALPPGTTDVVNLFLATDAQGAAVALFTVTDGSTNTVYSTMLPTESTTWTTPILVSNPANLGVALGLGTNFTGNSELLWAEITTLGDGYIFASDLPLGGVINAIQLQGPIANATSVDQSSNVVIDNYGNTVAIWGTVAGGVSAVYVDTKAVGESWTVPVALSLTGKSPKVALGNQETAVAVWIDSVNDNLLASTNLAAFDLQSPSNFVGKVVKNQFLNTSAYALKMKWQADPLLHIVRFEIRNNGTLVTTVPGSERDSVIYIPSKHTSGTYTLTAIATNGNQSLPVELTIKK